MIRLHTFGGLRLEAAGIAQVQRMRLALLAVIAASGTAGVSRDRLSLLLWPESDDVRGRGALKQALHALRRDLGQPELFEGVDPLRLNSVIIASDVGDFRAAMQGGALEDAVAVYRGAFLDGFHISTVEFEEWRDGEQRRLARLYHQALEQLAVRAEQAGRIEQAVSWHRRLVESEPLSATAALSLMRALARAGDRVGALRHADIHAAQVRAMLDVDVDVEVASFIDSLRGVTASSAQLPASPAHAQPPAVSLAAADTDDTRSETVVATGAATAPVSPPVDSRRRKRSAQLVLAAVVAALLLTAIVRTPDDHTVGFRMQGTAPAGVDTMVQSKLTALLLRHLPEIRVRRQWVRPARFDAVVSFASEGDSIWISGTVLDRHTDERYQIPPTAGRRWTEVTDAAAEHIAVAVAAAGSPLLNRWGTKAALPRTLRAYLEFQSALEAWRPPFNQFPKSSMDRLSRAHALDSTSGAVLALRALLAAKQGYDASADSALSALDRASVRKRAWEVGAGAVARAWLEHDLPRAHRAGHELLDSVPGSMWAILAAYDALGLGYASEAVVLLQPETFEGGRAVGERFESPFAFGSVPEAVYAWRALTLGQAYTLLGRPERAMAVTQDILTRYPEDRIATQSAVKALAGMGNVAEVERVCQQVLARSRAVLECQQGVLELRGRGHLAAARRVADRMLESLIASDSMSAPEIEGWRAYLATRSGDWSTAGPLLARMTWAQRRAADVEVDWLMVLAARGDTAAVREGLTHLAGPPDSWTLAQIAAMGGDKARATELVAEGFRHGRRRNTTLFVYPGLDVLQSYGPYRRLVAPIEVGEHSSHGRVTVTKR